MISQGRSTSWGRAGNRRRRPWFASAGSASVLARVGAQRRADGTPEMGAFPARWAAVSPTKRAGEPKVAPALSEFADSECANGICVGQPCPRIRFPARCTTAEGASWPALGQPLQRVDSVCHAIPKNGASRSSTATMRRARLTFGLNVIARRRGAHRRRPAPPDPATLVD